MLERALRWLRGLSRCYTKQGGSGLIQRRGFDRILQS
jgi:hypothetical protein